MGESGGEDDTAVVMHNAMILRVAFCLPSPCYSRRGARESFAPVRRRELLAS